MAKRVESALRRLFRHAEIFEAADAFRAAVEADVRRRTERGVVCGIGRRRFGACVFVERNFGLCWRIAAVNL